ncbi:MAG: hypothetical protein OEY63_08985 [Gemmatimonadota bacterium]|nr:hypothetical protein [Gemmatimonadota bacterium]MDH5805546.1 hypothetical protein [Gemmatimonadota bacterium]
MTTVKATSVVGSYVFLLVLVLSLVAPSAVDAQVRDTILPGEEVRVMFNMDIGFGKAPLMVRFEGEMLQLDSSLVVIQLDNPLVLGSEFVPWVEVRRCCEPPKTTAKRRALIGGLFGLMLGAGGTMLGCEWETINCRRDTGFELRATVFTLSRIAVVGGIGALIGLKWPAKEWRAYPLADVFVPPMMGDGPGLRIGAGVGLR